MDSNTVPRPRTLYEKLFDAHVVAERDDGTVLLYIDRHLVHEVTSPQAFDGLNSHRRIVRRPDLTLATSDHNVPTTTRPPHVKASTFLTRDDARIQVQKLERSVKKHKIPYLGLRSRRQGIVHVIGPELGFTLPGTTIVCGDSHTSTHGAFGALAFGIGTSEVEHVLATQTLVATRSRNMSVVVHGRLAPGVTSKDLMLHIIGTMGTAGGTGCVIEFSGPAIRSLTMESRMSLCNMSIEAGARAGLVATDDTTVAYVKGRELAPDQTWVAAESYWRTLHSDEGAVFDKVLHVDAADVVHTITWGTSPEQVVPVTGTIPAPSDFTDPAKQESCRQALAYMNLIPGTRVRDVRVDKVFIGSCTNARLEDFRAAAQVLNGKKIAPTIKLALAVPGSGSVKHAAEEEGIDTIFRKAGFEWREAGCSLCVGLNDDALLAEERCASTSNRNFENRQGTAGRTHLVSPVVAAATAIKGTLAAPSPNHEPLAKVIHLQSSAPMDSSDSESDNERPDQDSEVNLAKKPALGYDIRKPGSIAASHHFENNIKGLVAVIERANIDTDAIFPKQFCTTTERTGLGHALFHNLRYYPDGDCKTDFVLNQPTYQGAPILLATGPNFGCGSSREHAVWALKDFGFRCIIAPSFADIFYNNAFKNALLPIAVDTVTIDSIVAESRAERHIEINLQQQTIRLGQHDVHRFEIPERRKYELLSGVDEIETSLAFELDIRLYEDLSRERSSWLEDGVSRWMSTRRSAFTSHQQIRLGNRDEAERLAW
ncbi:hypothetical protein P3342_013036 [Pyrenophora teres f. teres]|uniref:3-isopropylmalate dehydratase n=1 Tax=Pyrenophora teres f. teres TaxID=97479 RepID=A0A6S6WEP2_9PLEO|nr:hypothetical protein HRS9139_07910 [Pyrenophora teres f. teres]KAE8832255.1 hypothetical protein PTNB85_06647 [Pyrenophora teres f. teres]KAE8855917.1 hypothetical protein PTNB29_08756 [Pyrenophora teres f. teres]KAE8860432.1 hypothetical protein PTNB73_08042 [Pyrenophora teres f. teres]KAK1911731.1 hypothetical protein P3342_013036 [Pyrenophora teres f. teres]